MKYPFTLLATAMLLPGCGGSNGDASDNKPMGIEDPTYTLSGTIDAAVANGDETVCADLDGDFQCSDDEPSAQAEQGVFSISSTNKAILESTLVAEMAAESSLLALNADAAPILMAPARRLTEGNAINGVTTLVAGRMAAGVRLDNAVDEVSAQLSAMSLSVDGVLLEVGNDAAFATLENNLLSVLTLLNPKEYASPLALLTEQLSEFQDVLLAEAPSDEQLQALVSQLLVATTVRPLNDTGVTVFLTDQGDSESASADYPGLDAHFGRDTTEADAQWVKLDDNGQPLSDDAAVWHCVHDKQSGLIWETKVDNADSPQHLERVFTYQVSGDFEPYPDDVAATGCRDGDQICTTEQYVNYLNEQAVCGITDWRLPTFEEVYGLLDFGETQVDGNGEVYGFNHQFFPNQSMNSEFAEGEIWNSSRTHTEFAEWTTEGARYFSIIQTRGAEKGTTYAVEIYGEHVEADYGTSWQFPIRLVASTSIDAPSTSAQEQ